MRLVLCASAGLIGALASCNLNSDPCDLNDFFCSSEEISPRLLTLSDQELISVTLINYTVRRPPTGAFSREIARRRAAVDIVESYLARRQTQDNLVRDVARLKSDLCTLARSARNRYQRTVRECDNLKLELR